MTWKYFCAGTGGSAAVLHRVGGLLSSRGKELQGERAPASWTSPELGRASVRLNLGILCVAGGPVVTPHGGGEFVSLAPYGFNIWRSLWRS